MKSGVYGKAVPEKQSSQCHSEQPALSVAEGERSEAKNLTLQYTNRLSKSRFFASAALWLRMTGYDLGHLKFWNTLNPSIFNQQINNLYDSQIGANVNSPNVFAIGIFVLLTPGRSGVKIRAMLGDGFPPPDPTSKRVFVVTLLSQATASS